MEGNSALILAARRPNLSIVKRLLAAGADAHLTADFGPVGGDDMRQEMTALACAVRGGLSEVVRVLLEQPFKEQVEKMVEYRALFFVIVEIEMVRRRQLQEGRSHQFPANHYFAEVLTTSRLRRPEKYSIGPHENVRNSPAGAIRPPLNQGK